jgi:hypothetical protein
MNALSLLLRHENKGLKRPEKKVGAGDGGVSIFLGVGMSRVVEILSLLCSLLAYGIAVSGCSLE